MSEKTGSFAGVIIFAVVLVVLGVLQLRQANIIEGVLAVAAIVFSLGLLIKQKWALIGVCLTLLVWIGFQFYAVSQVPSDAAGVAWWAHIGGFLAGILLIVPFRYKSVPLWRRGELPGGLEITVQDRRPNRREGSRKGARREGSKPKGTGEKRGPWG